MKPHNIHPLQWAEAVTVARQSCASIFRDGGTPNDALVAFGLGRNRTVPPDWSRAVEVIAEKLCQRPDKLAA